MTACCVRDHERAYNRIFILDFHKMRLQDLPRQIITQIGTILDPRARLMFLLALSEVYKVDDTETGPTYFCFFCFESAWFDSVVKEQTFEDEFALIRRRIRRKQVIEKVVNGKCGSHKRFLYKRYEHRDYSTEDRELNQTFLYLGTVSSCLL